MSSRVSGARVEATTRPPPPDLADVVACFWLGRWDLDTPHHTRLLGDPCVHICFEVSDPVLAPPARVVGVWTSLWRRTLAGRGYVHAAKLRAGAAGAFWDDASTLQNHILLLETTLTATPPSPACFADDDDDAFAALADLLRAHRRPSPDTALAVAACGAVRADPTLTRVAALSDLTGLHLRDLQRLFRQHVGASPKFVLRRHRLQEAAARLERGDDVPLADLARALGYADQAHLARDFKGAVGVPATVFAKEVHR